MKHSFRRRIAGVAFAGAAISLMVPALAGVGAGASTVKVKHSAPLPTVTFTYGNTAECWLPTWVAIEDNLFQKVGINVVSTPHVGASSLIVPQVATDQFDIGTVTAGAPLANAPAQGFNIKLIFGVDQPRTSYLSAEWISVSDKLWNAGFSIHDLTKPGVVIETTNAPGSPGDIETQAMLQAAGLTQSQVQTHLVNSGTTTQAQLLNLFQNGTVSVGGLVGPADDVAQQQGIAHEWLQYSNIVPWYQDCMLATSSAYLKGHQKLVQKFLEAVLMADKIIARQEKTTPRFNNALAAIVTKITGFTNGQVYLGRLPYVGGYGELITQSLLNVQRITVAEGVVPDPLPEAAIVPQLVDTSPLRAARKALGISGVPLQVKNVPNQSRTSYPNSCPNHNSNSC